MIAIALSQTALALSIENATLIDSASTFSKSDEPPCEKCAHFEFIGNAYSVEDNRLLYTEKHKITLTPSGQYLFALVKYSDDKGNIFAEKLVNFKEDLTAPSFEIYDKRMGKRTTVQTDVSGNVNGSNNNSKNMEHKNRHNKTIVIQKETKNVAKPTTKVVKDNRGENIVIDAGFDQFVTLNWADLLAGETIHFAFLAVDRGRLIEFTIDKTATTATTVVFSINPNNFFINMLVKPIYLTYETKSKRLLEFKGLTNIETVGAEGASGENYTARIEYRYMQ